MQLFVRVFSGAIFAVALAVTSAPGAFAQGISPGSTLAEYDNDVMHINAINTVHLIVRAIPVRF